MVHQRTRPPPQAAGRGGYRGMNQTTKCLNCGFGRGQFGVEFCDEYCSLDCYTSAKVTGRSLPRDNRYQHKNDGQATPWPKGLLVEAPPSPKPWRGRTWSNDTTISLRTTTCSSNLSADDSSSIESVADWHVHGGAGAGGGKGGADDRVRDGRGAGCELMFDGAGGDTDGNGSTDTIENRSPTVISGGGAASSNGASGGRSAGDGGCYSNKSSDAPRVHSTCCGEGVQDAGSRTQRRDVGVNSRGGGGAAGGGGDLSGVGVRDGEISAVFRRDLPPLAPVPRAGTFREQHGRAQSDGRNVDARVVVFAPAPAQATRKATPTPSSKNAAAAGALKNHSILPPAGVQNETEVGGKTAVGVTPVEQVGDLVGGVGGTAAQRLGGPNLEGIEGGRCGDSNDVIGTETGESATAGGHEGHAAAAKNATGAAGKNATGGDCAAAGKAINVVGSGEEAAGNGERISSMDGLLVGIGCGAAAGAGAGAGGEGEDVEVMKRIISCAPVRTYPTRAAIRQWRHMFLP